MENARGNLPAPNSALVRWSVFHSILLLSATIYSLSKETLLPLALSGAGSFLMLLFSAYRHLDDEILFHPANLVTALRLAGILTLASTVKSMNNFIISGVGLLLMAADSLDGWLARYTNRESELGEYFDKETDSFFMLVLCVMVVLKGLLSSWIVTMGILRYVFMLVLFFFKPGLGREERSSRARLISTVAMMILLSMFLPFELVRKPFGLLAILLLLFSFARDLQKILQRNKYA